MPIAIGNRKKCAKCRHLVGTALLPKKLLMNNTKGSDIIWLIRLQHISMCVLCMVKNLELKKAFPHKVLGIYIIHSDYTHAH